ncbi:MAG: biotin transporter BioY [Alphaproteobacteria bacterium]|jgi:biotin transport system substrate-specific component|uniref:biotin transporter BioY n=1 Tax=Pacificispira sp. TaxID=2888761 RepID=UPI002EB05E8E|nr:biotin transporter BioY [Pseudomonadota bacterium]
MSNAIATMPTLADTLWRAEGQARWVRNAILILAGSALMAIAAKINVPMIPVPMTMQTFAVLVIAMAYGWRLAGATLLAYLAEGAIGLPVFASGSGLLYMAGPTGGYLVGFFVAAVTVGFLAERGWDRGPVATFAANTIGTFLIFVFGLAWLTYLFSLSGDKTLGDAFGAAVANGVTPFLIGAVTKIALASIVLPLAWKTFGKLR